MVVRSCVFVDSDGTRTTFTTVHCYSACVRADDNIFVSECSEEYAYICYCYCKRVSGALTFLRVPRAVQSAPFTGGDRKKSENASTMVCRRHFAILTTVQYNYYSCGIDRILSREQRRARGGSVGVDPLHRIRKIVLKLLSITIFKFSMGYCRVFFFFWGELSHTKYPSPESRQCAVSLISVAKMIN